MMFDALWFRVITPHDFIVEPFVGCRVQTFNEELSQPVRQVCHPPCRPLPGVPATQLVAGLSASLIRPRR